jgi:hypothetical protein
MAALAAATRHNPVFKASYQRLRAEKAALLVACMRKLIRSGGRLSCVSRHLRVGPGERD